MITKHLIHRNDEDSSNREVNSFNFAFGSPESN